MSFGYSQNKIGLDLDNVRNRENASHLKMKLTKKFSSRVHLTFGGDYFITDFDETYSEYNIGDYQSGFRNTIGAIFAETDIFFSKKLAAKVGLRISNNDLLGETAISPRISFAYKVAKNSQFSLAYGDFTQTPSVDYIKYAKFHQFESEKASHYIVNFQYNEAGKTFRAEAYYKDYSNLVQYDTPSVQYNSVFSNVNVEPLW